MADEKALTAADKFRLLKEKSQAAKAAKGLSEPSPRAKPSAIEGSPKGRASLFSHLSDAPPPPGDDAPPPPGDDAPPPPEDEPPPPPVEDGLPPPPEEDGPPPPPDATPVLTRPKKKVTEVKSDPRPANVPTYLGLMVRLGKVKFEPPLKKDPFVRLKAKHKDKVKSKPIDQFASQARSSYQEFNFTKAEWPQDVSLEFAVCTAGTLGETVLESFNLEWPNDSTGMYFQQLAVLDSKKAQLGTVEVSVVDRDMCNQPETYNALLRKMEKLTLGDSDQPASGMAKYEIGETLGEGGCGIVKRCIRKSDGKALAVKIVKRENADEGEHEIQIMQMLSHPNCLRLEEVIETKQCLYMVMELCLGGELITLVNKKGCIPEAECIVLMRQIGAALAHCHQQGVVHRDLKPENLLFETKDPGSPIKLMDFGFAKFKENTMKTCCGTPQYVAPEICKQQRYGKEVDEWSLGVILYFMLSGCLPFSNDNQALLFADIKRGFVKFPDQFWEHISAEAKAVVQGLLTVDPSKRMTVNAMLESPWLAH